MILKGLNKRTKSAGYILSNCIESACRKRHAHGESLDILAVEKRWQEVEQSVAQLVATKRESANTSVGIVSLDERQANQKPFSMVLPPPNVTGTLHLGHGLTLAVQDAVVRWYRMNGVKTVWIPGLDHAGIATQVVVEKHLAKQGLSRHALGRENFLSYVWKWKNDRGHDILHQIKRMGASLDWSRLVFTMDEKFSIATRTAFVRLFNKGLIQRRERCINWSCALQSAISDVEVDMTPIQPREKRIVPGMSTPVEFGVIYDVFFPFADKESEGIIVSTTRPETMPGDVAVAVHPTDQRYIHLHGRTLRHPLTGKCIPIVTDEVLVDPSKGTGAVKITPRHDPNDFAAGKRHKLVGDEVIRDLDQKVIDDNGQVNFVGMPEIHKMHRFAARARILDILHNSGYLRDTRDHTMTLPVCSRTGDVVEPLVREQWFLDCTEMSNRVLSLVRGSQLSFHPASMHKRLETYLENIHPWCISRQLYWGHRIPAYRATYNSQLLANNRQYNYFKYIVAFCTHQVSVLMQQNQTKWVAGVDESEARAHARELFSISHSNIHEISLVQDEDVLDTWFSSGLYPFAAFGWPDVNSLEFQQHYPTHVLETGHDILFFWVARMAMLGIELTDKLPFKHVVLHAMVRDSKGRKMSKSLGNVIDPLDIINGISLSEMLKKLSDGNLDTREVKVASRNIEKEFPNGIPSCGSDALRFTLCAYTSQCRDINLNINRVVANKAFCNKLWNACAYISSKLPSGFEDVPPLGSDISQCLYPTQGHVMNEWIISCITAALYDFWLKQFCDVYLEWTKRILSEPQSLYYDETIRVLVQAARVGAAFLAPIMPSISNEIFSRLPRNHRDPSMLYFGPLPQKSEISLSNEHTMTTVKRVLSVISTIRSCPPIQRHKGPPQTRAHIHLCSPPKEEWDSFAGVFMALCKISGISFHTGESNIISSLSEARGRNVIILPSGHPELEVFACLNEIPTQDVISKELLQCERKQIKCLGRIRSLETSIAMPQYREKTPDHIQESHAQSLLQLRTEADTLQMSIGVYRQLQVN
eukprot:gene2797-5641_t